MRLALPQPFEDLAHTADVGVRVRGATPEEALARLALALGSLLSGGVAVAPTEEARLVVDAAGGGRTGAAVALLRELLYGFATRRRIPAAVEVLRADEAGAEALVATGAWDPVAHDGGADVKAVTWHAARLEPEGASEGRSEGGSWLGQVVFDI